MRFIIQNPYSSCWIYLDWSRIAQILTNFVTNSIKHTQKGYIKMEYIWDGDGIRIYVKDAGAGIPTDKQYLVFWRFEKLNPFVQGTGLGLSICKTIIEVCDGRINFTSEEGHGSCFWAWIPTKAAIVFKK